MDDILGYDCGGSEINEYRILGGMWRNDIDITELPDTDPRYYCAVIGDDGNAYAVSIYDNIYFPKIIRERENIPDNEEIPVVIKPISEMVNYEVMFHMNNHDEMDTWECDESDMEELKKVLNKYLKNNKIDKSTKVYSKKLIK